MAEPFEVEPCPVPVATSDESDEYFVAAAVVFRPGFRPVPESDLFDIDLCRAAVNAADSSDCKAGDDGDSGRIINRLLECSQPRVEIVAFVERTLWGHEVTCESQYDRCLARLLQRRAGRQAKALGERIAAGKVQTQDIHKELAEIESRTLAGGGKGQQLADTPDRLDPANWKREYLVTGIDWWDTGIHGGGMQPGWVVGVSAPPKAGKSALMMQVVLRALLNDDALKVVWARGEMSMDAVRLRSMQHLGQIPGTLLRIPMDDLGSAMRGRKVAAIQTLADIGRRLYMLPPGFTVADIEAEIKATGAKLAVVDYLQLLRPRIPRETRLVELEEASGELVEIAQRTGCVILVASALSIESARAETPNIQALFRGVGKAANDVDVAIALMDETPKELTSGPRTISVRCVAHRHAEGRTIQCMFDGATMTFTPTAMVGMS